MNSSTTWMLIVTAVPGVLSLLGFLWVTAFKLSALTTKVDTMWKVLILDVLQRQQAAGMIAHGSGWSNTEEYKATYKAKFSSERSTILFEIARSYKRTLPSEEELTLQVMKVTGWNRLNRWCEELGGMFLTTLLIHCVVTIREMHEAIQNDTVDDLPYPVLRKVK